MSMTITLGWWIIPALISIAAVWWMIMISNVALFLRDFFVNRIPHAPQLSATFRPAVKCAGAA